MPALLLGARRDVMDTIIAQLRDIGIEAWGTTNMDTAASDFNAKDVEVVAFGGGISNDVRERLKKEFTAQNPDVTLLDVFAPVAITQIASALRGNVGPKFASKFEIARRNGSNVVQVHVTADCDLRVQLFQSPVEGRTIFDQRVPAGPFELAIDDRMEGPNIVVVTLGEREIHTRRVE
jgi:hypothetical protein